ncbi:hypothetical protein CTI12_AA082010 [Artemisia annua]|uniref:Uncharacterized protein n=1 Tax=Artemisia annua TaxID=35608 RepID=A0A2U1Q2T9_ARTAN|nr:hypothetical protein CTI12_AA082010 [Artemisia annua]
MNKSLNNKRRKEQAPAEKETTNKKQKHKRWCASLDRKFIDIVVKIGGSQGLQIQTLYKRHLDKKTNIVDNFVNTNEQPSFVDTQDWTLQMIYYFKERWEQVERQKSSSADHVTIYKTIEATAEIDANIKKTAVNKRDKPDSIITDQSKPKKTDMCKKFIDIVLKLGRCQVYIDIGDPIQTCKSCKAKLWRADTKTKGITEKNSFTMCCKKGEVEIPKMANPPKELLELYTGNDQISKRFFHDIRKFNRMYSFTSMGGKVDKKVNNGHGPWIYRRSLLICYFPLMLHIQGTKLQ